jgi:hypothetical protein
MLAAACATALTACGTTTPTAAPATGGTAPAPAPSPSLSPSPSPSAAPTTKGPKLVKSDMSELENFAIDFGVPVVITTSGDAGDEYVLDAHPDGSVDFTGTAVTETTRMTMRPAKVRKRTERNKNSVIIVASPATTTSAPESCVTDEREGVLTMQPCEPGAAAQSWRLVPYGDSGMFELNGAHTAIEVDEGKIVKEDGWSALQATAVKP